MGLGPLETVSLGGARDRRDAYRKLLKDGVDPIEHRKAEVAREKLARVKTITLKDACARYVAAKRPGVRRSIKHSEQWDAALRMYAFPKLGDLSVRDIDVGLLVDVLEPIWAGKLETASRIRARIEAISTGPRQPAFGMGKTRPHGMVI